MKFEVLRSRPKLVFVSWRGTVTLQYVAYKEFLCQQQHHARNDFGL